MTNIRNLLFMIVGGQHCIPPDLMLAYLYEMSYLGQQFVYTRILRVKQR